MAAGTILILGKLILTFGALIGLAAFELWRLRRGVRSKSPDAGASPGSITARLDP